MSTRAQRLAALLPWIVAALLGAIAWSIYSAPRPMDCIIAKRAAAISLRATEICTGQMVGCRLTFKQVERVLQQQEAAKQCR